MFYQQKPSGNMPVVQEQTRLIHGVDRLLRMMQITIGMAIITQEVIISRLGMLDSIARTPGAFMICTEMLGSGLQTGTVNMRLALLPILRELPVELIV